MYHRGATLVYQIHCSVHQGDLDLSLFSLDDLRSYERTYAATRSRSLQTFAMSLHREALPDGWEADYDGSRWLYRFMPTDLVQYHFPLPGDEFPGSFEEPLESGRLLPRQSTVLSEATSTESSIGKTKAHGSDSPTLSTFESFFQPDSFHHLGPVIYPDLSPSTSDKIAEAVGDAEDDITQSHNKLNSIVPSTGTKTASSSTTESGYGKSFYSGRPGHGSPDLIVDTPVDSDASYDVEAEKDDEQSPIGLPPDFDFTEEMPSKSPPELSAQQPGNPLLSDDSGKRLWCEFCALKDCTETFAMDNTNQWIEHHMAHLYFKPPSLSVCWFCDNVVFRSSDYHNDPTGSFYGRMEHIWQHIVEENFGISDMRPDFHMVKHLKDTGLISEDQYAKSSQYTELPIHLRIPGSANSGEGKTEVSSRTRFRVMNASE